MSGPLRTIAPLAFFSIVVGALVGSYCDLSIGYPDLASLERMPESRLAMSGATQIFQRREDHSWTIEGPVPASIRRAFGTQDSADSVYRYYQGALAERRWVVIPPYSYIDESQQWSWCYGDAQLRLGVRDPKKLADAAYATRFEVDLSGGANDVWRRLGKPCPVVFPPVLPESAATAGIIGAIALFFVAAQIARQRALTLRGASQERVLGFGGLSAYFLWVPYLVVWQRFGPAVPLPEAVRWAGLALALAGVGLALWAMFTLGRHYDLELEVHRGHELVRRGPFAWVRHPIYTGLAVHFVGACLATGNGVLIAGTLLVTFPALYARARSEERLLRGRFGPDYARYAAQVPMLVPGVRRPRG